MKTTGDPMSKQVSRRLIALLLLPLAAGAADGESSARANATASPPTSVATRSLAMHADTVAWVTVASVSNLVNRAMSVGGLLSVEAHSYQLEVQRQWKGEATAAAVLEVGVRECSRPLLRGEQYLIFGERVLAGDMVENNRLDALIQPARERAVPTWRISGCGQTIPASQAEGHVVQLNQLYLSPVAGHRY